MIPGDGKEFNTVGNKVTDGQCVCFPLPVFSYSSKGKKSQISLTVLTSSCLRPGSPQRCWVKGLGWEGLLIHSFLSQLPEATNIPWHMAMSHQVLLLLSHPTPSFLSLRSPLMATLRPYLVHWGPSPHLKILKLITSAEFLLPYKIIYSQIPAPWV